MVLCFFLQLFKSHLISTPLVFQEDAGIGLTKLSKILVPTVLKVKAKQYFCLALLYSSHEK